jgi:hypothetical protein
MKPQLTDEVKSFIHRHFPKGVDVEGVKRMDLVQKVSCRFRVLSKTASQWVTKTTEMEENLEWRDVVGFEGLYRVSSSGLVKSMPRTIIDKNGLNAFHKGRVLKPFLNNDGYLKICLSKNSVCTIISAHRIVAQAFIANPEDKPTVNHKDGNKLNNTLDNLEWATRAEQVFHMMTTKLKVTLLDESKIVEIKKLYEATNNYLKCADVFGVSWHMAKYYIKKKTPIGVRA